MIDKNYDTKQRLLVSYLKEEAQIKNENILKAFVQVPRHLFVPEHLRAFAYEDRPLSIGHDQTISQPSLLAYILEYLKLSPDDKVLEIGSGCGYLAALLSKLVKDVYAIEIIPELGQKSKILLDQLKYQNIHIKIGDGSKGWPEEGLFNAIIYSARADLIPERIFAQLMDKGKLIAPVGDEQNTWLRLYTLQNSEIVTKDLIPVRFVPLVTENDIL